MTDYDIAAVTFGPDGWAIDYIDPSTDVRKDLVRSHRLELSARHPDYRDDMEAIHDRLVKALKNALEDLANTPPTLFDPEDDDEKGMGE